jgi:hypothetical protein
MCNKFSLFAPKLKSIRKQGKYKYPCKARKIPNVLEVRNINSFVYEIKDDQTLQNAT